MDCPECPYKTNELIHKHEYEAWDVLMASLGQFRLSPAGHVLGIDMATALKIAQIRGYDAAVVSELLQEAEAVIVSLMNERPENHGETHTNF